MTILVTGGSGLVGSNLREICGNDDFIYLSSKDCNLIDFNMTKKIFKQYNPNTVIHLAAKVGGLYMNIENNIQMLEDNLLINVNIIKVCRQLKIKKFIGCLSTCIFPDKISYPITENQLRNGPPHPSNEGYAYGKRMLAVMCDQMNKIDGYKYIYISPTNIYGKYDNFHLTNAHVIPNLIHKCIIAKNNNKEFIVKGTGKALRQFIYAKDLAKIIKFLITYDGTYNHIICSTNITDEISIKDIVQKICINLNYFNIKYDSSFSDGQYKKTVSNEKLRCIYPNLKFTSIDEGLKETIKWVVNNFDNIRK